MQTKTTTALAVAVVVGLAVAAAALVLGPDHITPSDERTGDEALAARLAEHAESGHRNIAAFTVAGDEVTFAGLGADEHTEFEIGSVTKTFTAQILINQIEAGRVTLDTTVGEIIDAGDAADLVVFDPDAEWTVDPGRFRSKGRNTPFAGMRLKGKVIYTIRAGKIVYSEEDTHVF